MNDIDIARGAKMLPIKDILNNYGVRDDEIELYGYYKAKIDSSFYDRVGSNNDGELILVTAVNPTPAGEGKTTVSIGLAQALSRIGKKAVLALREPSLGPCFGIKGGAAGGGYSQLVPMEDLNLHFTGDFHAITSANNLLCSLLDNHIQHGNELLIDSRQILIKRCVDLNDRALRDVVIGLGPKGNGFVREDHFTITVASEIMAILCLATSFKDMGEKLGNILVAYNLKGEPVLAKDLNAVGSMMVLLKDAIKPNAIQTLENTLAIVHGGPFANIAHGCNSIIATKYALKLGEYAITEAGFGADLGAEKFLDIKSRVAGLKLKTIVLVATVRSLKYNGGVLKDDLSQENIVALKAGIPNLQKHISNLRGFGFEPVVALNRFPTDTDEEIKCVLENVDAKGFEVNIHSKGGEGAIALASYIASLTNAPKKPQFTYELDLCIEDKIIEVAKKIYGANGVDFTTAAKNQIKRLTKLGYDKLPICMAKTQYSLSDNPKLLGCPSGFNITVRSVYVSAGAGMVVALTGDVMTMPGLPKHPAAYDMFVDDDGNIQGLS